MSFYVLIFRVDFLPAPKSGFGKNPQGCLRCGYSVYEAEKLIAAGRVRISICAVLPDSICIKTLSKLTF